MADVDRGTRRGTGSVRKNIALAAMLFAVSMTFIDQTIVAIATPNLTQELSLSRAGAQWIVNAYLLALAAAFALGGRVADVAGHRKVVTVGIIGFAISSGLCGATPTNSLAEAWIITFRVTQGVSAAFMVPAALAVVISSFALRERGRALAIFFGVSGGLTAIGPIAGGYLTQWTWRAIFWVNIPVAIIALILLALAHVKDQATRQRIDWLGAALVAVGMALSVFGLQQTQTWGWSNPATWACIVVGLAVLVLFVRVELRTPSPLLRLEIFRGRAFLVDNGVLFFSMFAFVPVFFFASVYAQVSLGYDADNAGLFLMVFFAGFAPAAQIGGRIYDRQGAKRVVIQGCVLGTVGFALWGWKVTDLHFGAQWWSIVIAGAGIGFLLGPASTDASNRAINASYGEVTGITQTVRNYGSSLGFAVLGSVLSGIFVSRLTDSLTGLGVPAAVVQQIASGGSGLSGSTSNAPPELQQQIIQAVNTEFATATRFVLWGMAIALAVALVISLFHPGGLVEDDTATSDGTVASPPDATS
jgi:EmrB/QacA subfamily drug resistance transporter